MKYLFKTLIIFTVTFFALKFILFLYDDGHTITYNVGNFKIKEELNTEQNNNYYFELTHEKFKINFSVSKNIIKKKK